MAEASSPLLRRRELAATLRLLRQNSGKTLDEAGRALEVSAATISRYETGHRVPRGRDIRDLCALYGVTATEQVERLVSFASDAREHGWWEAYSEIVDEAHATVIGLEAAAHSIEVYQASMIPGLLQTPDYTRALLRGGPFRSTAEPYSEREIERQIEVRQRRKAVLDSPGLRMRVVLDEAVLRRRVGSGEVMHAQLSRLADMSESGKLDVAVLPFHAGANPGMSGSFMILGVDSEVVTDVVYVHSIAGEVTLDDQGDLARCRAFFATLHAQALDRPQTERELRSAWAGFTRL